jgi:hypothetical protein
MLPLLACLQLGGLEVSELRFNSGCLATEKSFDRYVARIYWCLPVLCLVQLTTALGPVFADDTEKFDGSEFNATTFTDPSLSKHSLNDMDSAANRLRKKFERDLDTSRPSPRERDIAGGEDEEYRDRAGERAAFRKEEKFGAILDIAGDWVPNKIDPTSNGGFSIEPFNGTPVPYELNGHVDPNRGSP